jgi:hypothetical protein
VKSVAHNWWRRRLPEDGTERFALLESGSAEGADVVQQKGEEPTSSVAYDEINQPFGLHLPCISGFVCRQTAVL